MNDTLVKMLRQNVRLPDTLFGDLNAQIAACSIGNRRLTSSPGSTATTCWRSLRRAGRPFRAPDPPGAGKIPDGTYAMSTGSTTTASTSTSGAHRVAVTIKGSDITFDLAGTTDQVATVQLRASGAQAAAYFAVRAITDRLSPTTAGAPLDRAQAAGRQPRQPARARAGQRAHATIKRVTTSMLAALAPIVPDKLTRSPRYRPGAGYGASAQMVRSSSSAS